MKFLDDGILGHIVTETNRSTVRNLRQIQQSTNQCSWTDRTVDELKIFMGIIIAIGLTQIRGQVKQIWSNQPSDDSLPGPQRVNTVCRGPQRVTTVCRGPQRVTTVCRGPQRVTTVCRAHRE